MTEPLCHKKYRTTQKYKIVQKRYHASTKGKAAMARYHKSPKGKAALRLAHLRAKSRRDAMRQGVVLSFNRGGKDIPYKEW